MSIPTPPVEPKKGTVPLDSRGQSPFSGQGPYLEHFPEPGGVAQRVPLLQMPFQIGRSTIAHYIIYSSQVSKEHAVISRDAEGFRIRDLGSTNGTFVNGRRVTVSALVNGDIVHFANKECRFVNQVTPEERNDPTDAAKSGMLRSVFQANHDLGELIDQQQATVVFQPTVVLATRAVVGYEALCQGAHPDLNTHPADLFRMADPCGRAALVSLI